MARVAGLLHQKRPVARRSALLVLGSALGQGMLLLGTLIGARFFTPSAFGVLGVYVTIVVVFGMLSTGRMEAAIPIPRRDARARDLLEASFLIVPVVTLAAFVFMMTLAAPVLNWADAEVLRDHSWMVPAGAATLGARALLIGWATRKGSIRTLALGRLANGGLTGIGFVVGSFVAPDVGWLIGAWLVGQVAEMSTVASTVLKDVASKRRPRGFRRRRRAIRRFSRFPRVLVWSHIMEQLGPHLPTTLIAGFFGTDLAGVYSIIYKVVARPAAIIGSSAHVVVTSEASKRLRQGMDLVPILDVGLKRLTRIGLAIFTPLALIGPFILPTLLGPRWESAGMILLAIIPGSAVDFVVVPLVPLLNLVERIFTQFSLSVLRLCAVALSIGGSAALGLGPIPMLFVLSTGLITIDAVAILACRHGMKFGLPAA